MSSLSSLSPSGRAHCCPTVVKESGFVPPLVCYNAITTTHCSAGGTKPWRTVTASSHSCCVKHAFGALAKEHHVGAALRGMSRWKQFVAMAAAQLTGRQSLRDIEAMLTTQGPRLYYLGGAPVPRSSLARLDARQPPYPVRGAVPQAGGGGATPGHRFRFKGQPGTLTRLTCCPSTPR